MASDAVRAESRWKGTTLQNLAEGRRLYILKCSGCHSLRSPSLLTEEKWQEQIIEMQKKAEISDQESTAILRYLLTMRILPKEEKAY